MFKLRNLGLLLAGLVTALAISGAAALIALDFVGVDGLAHAWSSLTGEVSQSFRRAKLDGMADGGWLWHGASSTLPGRGTGIG